MLPDTGVDLASAAQAFVLGLGFLVSLVSGAMLAFFVIRRGLWWGKKMNPVLITGGGGADWRDTYGYAEECEKRIQIWLTEGQGEGFIPGHYMDWDDLDGTGRGEDLEAFAMEQGHKALAAGDSDAAAVYFGAAERLAVNRRDDVEPGRNELEARMALHDHMLTDREFKKHGMSL